MRGRPHNRKFKLSIVRQLASREKRPAQVCREHNLAASMVARWRQEYDLRGDAAFAPAEPTATEGLEAKKEGDVDFETGVVLGGQSMQAVDQINGFWGRETLFYGVIGLRCEWQAKQQRNSKHATTRWHELLIVT